MSVKIIVDSSADLREEIRQKVEVIPLTIRFGDTEYADGVDITHKEFYEKLVASEELPTTSQVTPDRFTSVFAAVKEAGDTAVVLTISSELSGTYQSAVIAAADFADTVYVVDSLTVAIAGGILTEYALQLAEEGKSAKEIADILTVERENACLMATLDTLEYLKKGGRISATVALAGSLLGIKPVIGVQDGKVVMLGKARGAKQASSLLAKEIEALGGVDFTKPVLLGYTGVSDEQLTKYIQDNADFWGADVHRTVVGSAVGTHAGPGAVAVSFFKK